MFKKLFEFFNKEEPMIGSVKDRIRENERQAKPAVKKSMPVKESKSNFQFQTEFVINVNGKTSNLSPKE